MAFRFIDSSSSGSYQTLLNRLIENPTTIDLTDTPGVLSLKSIPFDGINDSIQFPSIYILESVGASGASANSLAFDCWIKPNITGSVHNTFFDFSIKRDSTSAAVPAFDGIYSGHILTTGGNRYVEFRVNHYTTYSLTSFSTVNITAWTHVMCMYTSADKMMKIFINGNENRRGALDSVSTNIGQQLGVAQSFGGILDELRFWIASGAASSVAVLASTTSIGVNVDTLAINDFKPSADTVAAWYRLDSVSSFQLFSSVVSSIQDYTQYKFDGTPNGFEGSDEISSETTVVQGLSASGDLRNLLGGTYDHGGLLFVDTDNDKILLESGSENIIKDQYNSWIATGSNVVISTEDRNIFYGTSSIKVNCTSADTGVSQNISNSALLYSNNQYTCTLRFRSITGSTSARIVFTLGSSANAITAVADTTHWRQYNIFNTLMGADLTGRIDVTLLNQNQGLGGLFQLDGLQVIEGDYPASFIAPSRTRKSGQIFWMIED
jgi:hypothetical protein